MMTFFWIQAHLTALPGSCLTLQENPFYRATCSIYMEQSLITVGHLELVQKAPRLFRQLPQRQHVLLVACRVTIWMSMSRACRPCAPLVFRANSNRKKIKLLVGLVSVVILLSAVLWKEVHAEVTILMQTRPHALHAVLANTKTKSINPIASLIVALDFRLTVIRHPAFPVALVNIKMKINKPDVKLVRLVDTKMQPNKALVVKHAVLVNIKTPKVNQVVKMIAQPGISSTLHEPHVWRVRLANTKTNKTNPNVNPIATWAIIFHQWKHHARFAH